MDSDYGTAGRSGDVALTLSSDEALVLFDMLGRWLEDRNGECIKDIVEDRAEPLVLNSVYCELERILPEPFLPEYASLVAHARRNVSDRHGPPEGLDSAT